MGRGDGAGDTRKEPSRGSRETVQKWWIDKGSVRDKRMMKKWPRNRTRIGKKMQSIPEKKMWKGKGCEGLRTGWKKKK